MDYKRERLINKNTNMMISTSKRKYEGEEEEKGKAKQARISQIPLAIHKETSFLDGIQLVEYLPAERVRLY